MILPSPPDDRTLARKLAWPVSFSFMPGLDTLYVSCDPQARRHTITVPSDRREPVRWMELQHEFAHCLLSETIHHLFAGTTFARNSNKELMQAIAPACRVATDWYVDHVIYTRWPQEGREEIEELLRLYLGLSRQKKASLSPTLAWGLVLCYAQGLQYKAHKGLVRRFRQAFPDVDSLARKTFLRHPPDNPTAKGLVTLINRILKVASGGKLSAHLIVDGSLEVLEVRHKNGQKI